jgi:hypothetical protein
MSAIDNYHIKRIYSSRSLLFYNLIFVGATATLFTHISERIKNILVRILNKELRLFYVVTSKFLDLIKKRETSIEKATKFYCKSQKRLSKFRSIYSKMEKVRFFDNPKTESLVNSVLINLYSIDSHFKMIALSEKQAIPDDKSLKHFASTISLGSIEASCLTAKEIL